MVFGLAFRCDVHELIERMSAMRILVMPLDKGAAAQHALQTIFRHQSSLAVHMFDTKLELGDLNRP